MRAALTADKDVILALLHLARDFADRAAGVAARGRGRKRRPPMRFEIDPQARAALRAFVDHRMAAWAKHPEVHGPEHARQLAHEEVLALWHRLSPPHHKPGHCAGCGRHLHSSATSDLLQLPDGAVVHLRGAEPPDLGCLTAYGDIWRQRAADDIAVICGLPEGRS
jgi:hypothetical protein